MQFTVTGVFKESEEASTPVVRHFSRTFLVVPQVKKIQNSDSLGPLRLAWHIKLCPFISSVAEATRALRLRALEGRHVSLKSPSRFREQA